MAVKPMLAATWTPKMELSFPLYVSPKIDGVRAMVVDGIVRSRSGKHIPNVHVQAAFKHLEGLDGELTIGPLTAPDLMQRSMKVMSSNDELPGLRFNVFDTWSSSQSFANRWKIIQYSTDVVPHHLVDDMDELLSYEQLYLAKGYEGVMLNRPDALYKHGRATPKTQELVKLKRFADSEAIVVGVVEQMHNENEAYEGELGQTKRATKIAGKRGAGTLGALLCETLADEHFPAGLRFDVGTGIGLTAELRREWWANPAAIVGKTITYKHFAVTGVKDKPRQPVLRAVRAAEDML